MTYFKRWNRCF